MIYSLGYIFFNQGELLWSVAIIKCMLSVSTSIKLSNISFLQPSGRLPELPGTP